MAGGRLAPGPAVYPSTETDKTIANSRKYLVFAIHNIIRGYRNCSSSKIRCFDHEATLYPRATETTIYSSYRCVARYLVNIYCTL